MVGRAWPFLSDSIKGFWIESLEGGSPNVSKHEDDGLLCLF